VSPQEDFQHIVREFADPVYNHALRMLANREDAEEATQDVFLRVHRSLDAFRGEARISTWIWRITVNICLNKRAAQKRVFVDVHAEENLTDGNRSPLDETIALDRKAAIERAVRALAPREASVVTLYYNEGMNYAEIAEILSIPAGSVATALYRAKEKLRILLAGLKEGL
jgi:RNA polymerase sigma-70 factor, ECF subfamily